jgi:hypothetical protein
LNFHAHNLEDGKMGSDREAAAKFRAARLLLHPRGAAEPLLFHIGTRKCRRIGGSCADSTSVARLGRDHLLENRGRMPGFSKK